MSPTSFGFFVFLIATAAFYFLCPKKARWCVLLFASNAFYYLMGGLYSLLLVNIISAVVCFFGIILGNMRDEGKPKGKSRITLLIGIFIVFSLLIITKYTGIFLHKWGLISIVGISFYSLQAVAYLVDIYTGRIKPFYNFFKVLLFLSFFPQLIQGPISRHSQIAKDLFAGHGFDMERMVRGIKLMIWGYFMKLIVADRCAVIVNTVFNDYTSYGGTIIILTLLLYSIQLYADFAGGINITIGIAKIVGIELPINFRQPFFATSVADFWRRWHITLGAWLKDYIFYPLAISKPLGRFGIWARKHVGVYFGKLIPATVATFSVYFVMGIWHGASWQGFVFGIMNGVIISTSLYLAPFLKKLNEKMRVTENCFWYFFAMLRTLGIMMFLRYFARSKTLVDALQMIKQTVLHVRVRELWNGMLMELGLTLTDYIVLIVGIIIILLYDILKEKGRDVLSDMDAYLPAVQFAMLLAMLVTLTAFGIYSADAHSASFIYGQY